MIYTYTQQTILATNFSHSKIPSQVSPIGHGTHTEKKFIDKENYQKSSYGSGVPNRTYHPLPNPETSRIYLTPSLCS